MIESPLHRIIRKTGRKPSQCCCKLCQMQCHTPCLGTPQDIEKLIDAGYASRLAVTEWAAGIVLGVAKDTVPMLQAVDDGNYCTFFHDGKCELHDKGLKPTEGRLSHHSQRADNFVPKRSISWNVAKEWFNPENRQVVMRLLKKYQDEIKRGKAVDNENA